MNDDHEGDQLSPRRSIQAKPYSYSLPQDLYHLAFVIIDMQNDFMEIGGYGDLLGNDVTRLQPIVPVIQNLRNKFHELDLLVIQTIEGHRSDLSDCPKSKQIRGLCDEGKRKLTIGDEGPMGRILVLGEYGNQIIPELAPIDKEIVITKPGKGAFYNTNLHEVLQAREISHLIISGITTEVCVQSTIREGNDRGYECLLVEDGTESYFPEFKRVTCEMIVAQAGIVGWVASSEEILKTLISSS
jgi:biuret amidohydrolase